MKSRESYLPTMNELLETGSPYNWRMRHVIALQVSPACTRGADTHTHSRDSRARASILPLALYTCLNSSFRVPPLRLCRRRPSFLRSFRCRLPFFTHVDECVYAILPLATLLTLASLVQLPDIIMLFSEKSVFNVVVPLCFNLVADPVAEVRNAAYCGVSALLVHFKKEKKMVADVLKRLELLAKSENFSDRMSFCGVLRVLVLRREWGGAVGAAGGEDGGEEKEESEEVSAWFRL